MAAISFAQSIRNKVNQKIEQGSLSTHSNIDQIPMIGKLLRGHIAESLAKSADQPVIVMEVLDHIMTPLPSQSAKEAVIARIAQLCQNKHPSRCLKVKKWSESRYFVRDINKGCALSLPTALQAVLRVQNIAHPQFLRDGLQEAIDRVQTRQISHFRDGSTFSPAAQCECLDMDRCRAYAPSCIWLPASKSLGGHSPQCVPTVDVGFEGLPPYLGQIRPISGFLERDVVEQQRGEYGAIVGVAQDRKRWRRQSRLRHVTPSDQADAFSMG